MEWGLRSHLMCLPPNAGICPHNHGLQLSVEDDQGQSSCLTGLATSGGVLSICKAEWGTLERFMDEAGSALVLTYRLESEIRFLH